MRNNRPKTSGLTARSLAPSLLRKRSTKEIWWRGVTPANSVTDQMGHVLDFMPTLLEIAGTRHPSTYGDQPILPLEGRSLMVILRVGERAVEFVQKLK